jgi:hypothetical protein
MKWITRERLKIDRIAYPWLIRNFVDIDAGFGNENIRSPL